MHKIISSLFIAILLILGGCTSQPHARHGLKADAWTEIDTEDANNAWWRIQFVKQWPDGSAAPFYYDVLLAEQIIRPALIQHHEKIELWRFHRRAGRDSAGSKFSFIFYANANNAQTIAKSITSNQLLQEMMENKLIEKLWVDDFSDLQRPRVSDTSDKEWPPEIQNSWPYFIMGVSQSWLALINEFSSRKQIDVRKASLEEIIEYYSDISEQIDLYWGENGGHAYIHHLSALFAYRPIKVRF